MLPKKNRLTTDEVECVQKYGKILRSPQYSIRYTTLDSTAVNGAKNESKCAVVVGKKVEPTSVVRHTMKRAVYRALQNSDIDFSVCSSKKRSHIAITLLRPHAELVQSETYKTIVEQVRELVK